MIRRVELFGTDAIIAAVNGRKTQPPQGVTAQKSRKPRSREKEKKKRIKNGKPPERARKGQKEKELL